MGRRLKLAMTRAGYSVNALADRMAVDASTVSVWRSGERQPGETNLRFAAMVLRVPLNWLKSGVGEIDDPIPPEEGGALPFNPSATRQALQRILTLVVGAMHNRQAVPLEDVQTAVQEAMEALGRDLATQSVGVAAAQGRR